MGSKGGRGKKNDPGKRGEKTPRRTDRRVALERRAANRRPDPGEIRREADRAKTDGLNDAPASMGLTGPQPTAEMRWRVETWDPGLQGWRHEAYTRTQAEARTIGRRFADLGQRWRHTALTRGGVRAMSERDTSIGGTGSTLNRGSSSGGSKRRRRTVTGYDASKPQSAPPSTSDHERSAEEIDLVDRIRAWCREKGSAVPGGLSSMTLDALEATAVRIGLDA